MTTRDDDLRNPESATTHVLGDVSERQVPHLIPALLHTRPLVHLPHPCIEYSTDLLILVPPQITLENIVLPSTFGRTRFIERWKNLVCDTELEAGNIQERVLER